MGRWIFKTRKGLAEIVPQRGGSFTLLFDGQALEEHSSQMAAADALANGTCYWPSFGNPTGLGIPEDISEWTFVP